MHRHQWVRLRAGIQNALQAIALASGLRRRPGLWSYDGQAKIAFLPLPPYASDRQSALQAMYRKMEEEIENLTQQITEQAAQRCGPRLLLSQPGVGPVTALATEVFLGDPQNFADGKALASYVGMILATVDLVRDTPLAHALARKSLKSIQSNPSLISLNP
jgi:transposase